MPVKINTEIAWSLLEHGRLRSDLYDDAMDLIFDDIVVSSLFKEGKAPALRKSDAVSGQQAIAASLDPRFKSKTGKAFKKYKREMDQLESRMMRRMAGMFDTYTSGRGKLRWGEFRRRAESELVSAHHRAFELGMRASGLTNVKDIMENDPTTSKRIQSSIDEEMKYFKRLLDDVKEEQISNSMAVSRAYRYAESIYNSFNQARVMGMPSMSIMHWHLESDNPCNDCKLIAKYSPYTRELLPTVPRAGTTRCLSNCACTLEVEVVSEKKLGQIRRRHLPRKEILRRIHRQQKQQLGRVI